MLDLNHLEAFVRIAHRGSFSIAAEELSLTQPAVSKRVAALEAGLDTPLFDRIGRSIQLTEAGRTLLPRAEQILARIEDSRRAVRNLAGQVEGPLKVGTSHHIGLQRPPPVLRSLVGRYPDVELDLRFLDSEVILAEVEHGQTELGLATLPPVAPETMACRPIWTDQLVVVVAPGHALSDATEVKFEHLARERAILPGEGTYTRRIIERALQPLGINLRVTLATNYLETIKMMVSVGLGWSVLPLGMVDADVAVLPVPELRIHRTLGTVHHRERTLSNASRALMDMLKGHSD
mgnify:CR=1 FL=1